MNSSVTEIQRLLQSTGMLTDNIHKSLYEVMAKEGADSDKDYAKIEIWQHDRDEQMIELCRLLREKELTTTTDELFKKIGILLHDNNRNN